MLRLIQLSIERPIAIVSLMILIVFFGYIAASSVPIQMSPDIEKPMLQVRVSWPGAAPEDVDREIIGRLEKEFSNLSLVEEISSNSSTGSARISLTYSSGADMDKSLTELVTKISGVSGLPYESKSPIVRTSNSDDSPIARLALISKNPNENIDDLGVFVEKEIMEPLSRIKGVAETTKYGGKKRTLKISVDPEKLVRYQIDLASIIETLRRSSVQLTVGSIEEGKRNYVVRTESNLYNLETAGNIILRSTINENNYSVPVFLKDVANIDFVSEKQSSFRRLNGSNSIIINILREQGSNVVETTKILKREIKRLNNEKLVNKNLSLKLVYTETTYISSALNLVKQNIWIGGSLALFVLILFLRSFFPTLIIFIAIPISVIGTFVAIAGLGLSINVISLAGLAFAVGMVVDASIISQENIFRLRQKGLNPVNAAYNGARQVWAPILGSALTTIIVFIPIILLNLPIGQLFRDIAIAISVSVIISVFVSITIIPMLSSKLLSGTSGKFQKSIKLPLVDFTANKIKQAIVKYAEFSIKKKFVGIVSVFIILISAGMFVYKFFPKLDYLPDGNANFVFGRILVPPGYSMPETLKIAEKMENAAKPLWNESNMEIKEPKISRFFFVAYSGGAFAGASAKDPSRVSELKSILMRPIFTEPGARAFVRQASLFGRSVGGSRSIRIDIMGTDLEKIHIITKRLHNLIRKEFPLKEGNQVRVLPNLSSGTPMIKILPNLNKLAQSGISVRDFSQAIDVFNDGLVITQIPIRGELIDLTLSGKNSDKLSLKDLEELPIVNKSGDILRVNQLSEIKFVSSPQQIRRISGRQSQSINLRPDENIPLESSVSKIQNEIIPKVLDQANNLSVVINIKGAASELNRSWIAMKKNVLISIVVIFFLLVILLRNFLLPFIIILSVPVACAGGLGGLTILNLFVLQPLDMLTMLGFVILTGVVVNNSILMVEQTVLHVREEKLNIKSAILETTKNRIRPIFLSTLTSLFGLIPLVIFPGAGSELYRGIGTVVFGGLALSTITTLIMIPPLLMIAQKQILNSAKLQKVAF